MMQDEQQSPPDRDLHGTAADLMERNCLALLEKTYEEVLSQVVNLKCPLSSFGSPDFMSLSVELQSCVKRLADFESTATALRDARRPAFSERLSALSGQLEESVREAFARQVTIVPEQPAKAKLQTRVPAGPRWIDKVIQDFAKSVGPPGGTPGGPPASPTLHTADSAASKDQQEKARLDELEATYREFCTMSQAFSAQQYPLGTPAEVLNARYQQIARFDQRFVAFEPVAQALEQDNRPAFRSRLTVLHQDVKGVMKIVGDMCQSRVANDSDAVGIAWKAREDILGSMDKINDGWRVAFGVKKKT
jgi:hypothetical protein